VTHPMQLPVMNAHGVGLSVPSVPMVIECRTDLSGAANMKLATIMPRVESVNR
jgi:hypothetical protein